MNTMLKHEDSPQAPPHTPPAAQVRVTPEELAAAITSLQIRKEGQPGTIAIGDAVEELGLDVTPEEVLAEVQARRTKPKLRRDYRALVCAFACVALFAVTESVTALHRPGTLRMDPISATNATQADTLSEVGDEQQVYVDMHGLRQLTSGEAESQVKIYRHVIPQYKAEDWGVIKHDGKVYMQGYVVRSTEKQLAGKTFSLYNTEDIMYREHPDIEPRLFVGQNYQEDAQVTLPVQRLQVTDSQQADRKAMVTVSDVHPDNQLWDEF